MVLNRIAKNSGMAGYLDGHMLIAMPGMEDDRFVKSLIYICAHSPDGAMGLIVNQRADDMQFRDLLLQLDIISDDRDIRLPNNAETIKVLKGGPVETGRGFVLHSADFFIENSTLPIDTDIGVCLTATLDILKAIVAGQGPNTAMMVLGYAAWGPGQLESEILRNGWLTCAADEALLFTAPLQTKYDLAMRKLGVNATMLSADFGRA